MSLLARWRVGQTQIVAVEASTLSSIGPDVALVVGESTHCTEDGVVAALVGRLRIALPSTVEPRAGNDAARLMAAYRLHGEQLAQHVQGGVAWVLVDPRAGRLMAAGDRIGRMSLFYRALGDRIVVGTRLREVIAAVGEVVSHDSQALHDYFFFQVIPSPRTLYRGVGKLRDAEALLFGGGGVALQRFWRPAFSEDRSEGLASLAARTRSALREAVARARASDKVGCFLSGGLDSSTVAVLLAETDPSAEAFSMGFDAAGYDEMEYARITARYARMKLNEYYVQPAEVARYLPQVLSACDEPFGNSSIVPAYLCARFARECGFEVLLAGDGGDELFAGNERYRKQLVFERYVNVPQVVRTVAIEPLVALAQALRVPGAAKARSYIEQSLVPLPDRLQTYNFLLRNAPDKVFCPEFLAQVDPNLALNALRETYAETAGATPLNRMLAFDWKLTLRDNDLVKVNTACRLAEVDVRYPMLDETVVDVSCQVPSRWKIRGGELRWFYKQALRPELPAETIAKRKHGFGLPFGQWSISNPELRAFVGDRFSAARSRGIVRPEFLDEIWRLQATVHAAYYGEFVWLVVALETWLSAESAPRS